MLSKPVYTHTNIPIHWTSNQSPFREWTLQLESNGMPQYPYNLASSRSIAFYANEHLLTATSITNMVLRAGHETEEWEDYFIKAGISADSAESYAATFAREKPRKENLQMMDRAMLRHHLPSFPNSISKWLPNNSESSELIGKCLPEWQTLQFLRPTSSYTVVPMNRCTGLGWMLQPVVFGQIAWYAQTSPLVNHRSLSSWHDLLIGHSSWLSWISSILGIIHTLPAQTG